MKKWICLTLVVIGGGILLIKFLEDSELARLDKMKLSPIKYAYFRQSTGVNMSLASIDIDCMEKIRQYYDHVRDGKTAYLPSCFEYGIPVNDSVYVLEERDNLVRVLVFYKAYNGKEKYFISYVLKETVHDKPYIKN